MTLRHEPTSMNAAEERVGLVFLDRPSLSEQIELARYAERQGFESVWVCETRLVRDAITLLAAFATATDRIKLATGVVNNWTRTSALIAVTLATLHEMSQGRTMLVIGAYWDPLARKQGIRRRKTLTAMREYVSVVRGLLRLETVTLEGEVVRVDDLRLDLGYDQPQEPILVPIYIGATGPRMMELTGEVGDGIFHNFFTSVDYLTRSLERAETGAQGAGRTLQQVDMPQMASIAMSEDGEAARHTARHSVAMYIGQQPRIARASEVDEETIQQIQDTMSGWPPRTGGIEDAMALVGDQTIDQLCAAGTPDMCRQRVQEYMDAGASYPVLCPLTPNIAEIIDAFAPGS